MNSSRKRLAYRSVLTVPRAEPVLDTVRRISAQWLRRKYETAPLNSGRYHLDDTSVLNVEVSYSGEAAEHATHLQLLEERPEATWLSTITTVADADGALVLVALELFPNGEGTPRLGRAGLVPDLVRDLKPFDGPVPLTAEPAEVTAGRVGALVDVLCEPARLKPVIVAAHPLHDDPVWSDRVDKAMLRCAGAASLYLLRDVNAVNAFRTEIGEHHYLTPGSIRMFLTEVEPGWPQDGPRHRLWTGVRISNPADSAWLGVARTVQRISAEAPVPEPLSRLTFSGIADRNHEERQAALSVIRPSEELAAMHRDIDVLTALLTQADEELKAGALRADLSARSIASLEQQLAMAKAYGYQDTEDALSAFNDLERARAENDELRRQLRGTGRYEANRLAQPLPGQPNSFEELWERLNAWDGIRVTADKDRALVLDEGERSRVWAAKAWQGLRALDSYARAACEGFKGGFYQYCESPPPGMASWPHKQVAMTESESTMNAWGKERIFSVPLQVHPSGRQVMQAHLKLHSRGSPSPRIYFLDDTKGSTGQVIVGYIGPHLTNTKTN
ncbi:hypothetical protein AB0H37_43760 [Actinomadura sp. NPDC023710]|uniref:hypothetical protein n=1 Tax=Actinomadura sp. NPDC023710 TaxID=3158219 RepID=UPI0033E684A9